MSYEKYYPGGWQSGESGGTPITPEALDHIEQGIIQTYKDFAPAVESPDYPGCYYRTVDGVVEWLNPPMVLGVEYRTTERWQATAVYTKLFVFGAMPNSTTRSVAHGASVVKMLRVSGTFSSALITIPYANGNNRVDITATRTNVIIMTNYDASSVSAYAQIWYTKD